MEETKQTVRVAYLDAVKTIALLLVFALHTQRGPVVTQPAHNPALFYAARCCMPLFFMVNGSLILRKASFPFSYYKKKLGGIAQALVFSGLLIGVYVKIVHHFSAFKAGKEMLKGFLSYTPYAFLWFFYTFVMIYTLLLAVFPWMKKHIRLVTGSLLLVCLCAALASDHSIAHGGFFIQDRVTQRLRLWTWLFYFCLGYLLSTADLKKWNAHGIRLLAVVFTIVCVGWQYWLCWRVTGQIESNYMYDSLPVIVWSALVFLSFRVSPGISAVLARFAPYSYGAFLLHGFLVDGLQLQSAVHGALASTLVWILLSVVCWTASWMLSKVPVVSRFFRY